ncbi:MAG: hypothetical protein ACXWC0_29415, partial [Burkholderiales bacterium]
GANAWTTGPLTPRVQNSLVCDICHRKGKNPDYFGRCECGANAWTDPTPDPRVPASERGFRAPTACMSAAERQMMHEIA